MSVAAKIDGCYDHELALARVRAELEKRSGAISPTQKVEHLNWWAAFSQSADATIRALAGVYARLTGAQLDDSDVLRLRSIEVLRSTLRTHGSVLSDATIGSLLDELDEAQTDAESAEVLPTGKRGGRSGTFITRERMGLRAAGLTAAEVDHLLPPNRASRRDAAGARDRQKKASRPGKSNKVTAPR